MAISWRNASAGNKRRYVLVYFLFLLTNGVAVLLPLLYGWFVGSLQYDGENVLKYLWMFALGYFGLTLVKWMFHGPGRILERKLAFEISAAYLDQLIVRLLNTNVDWHKDHHSGSVMNRLKKSHAALRNFFQNGFMYFETILQLLISITAMIWFAPMYGMLAVAIAGIAMWVNFKFDRPYIKALHRFNEKDHQLSARLTDYLGNIFTVITLRLGKFIRTELSDRTAAMFPDYRRVTILGEAKWFVANLLVTATYLTIIVGYVYSNYSAGADFNFGGLVTLVSFVTQFNVAFYTVAHQYSFVVQYYADVVSADIIKDNPAAAESVNGSLPEHWKTLEINHLTFGYAIPSKRALLQPLLPQAHARAILQNVSLVLKRGCHVALTGKSGVGKSTLLALLRGLYPPPQQAIVLTDGKEVQWSQLVESTTLFPQDPEIFEHTLHYNLTMGLSFAVEEIWEACRLACIDEFIQNLPEGLNTIVKERGGNLSGGEKQRLAFARGILAAKNTDIVLMDEPTSNVDAETAEKIYRNVTIFFADKVIISTLHNLDLLKYFDCQVSLQHGNAVMSGNIQTTIFGRGIKMEL